MGKRRRRRSRRRERASRKKAGKGLKNGLMDGKRIILICRKTILSERIDDRPYTHDSESFRRKNEGSPRKGAGRGGGGEGAEQAESERGRNMAPRTHGCIKSGGGGGGGEGGGIAGSKHGKEFRGSLITTRSKIPGNKRGKVDKPRRAPPQIPTTRTTTTPRTTTTTSAN